MPSYSPLLRLRAETNLFDLMPCFIGFQLSYESLAYLQPRVTAIYQALTKMGWPVRLVWPEKWHVTVLWFERLIQDERAVLWRRVQAMAQRGTWDRLDFGWRGLTVWPDPKAPKLVALEAEKFRAVSEWGLKTWLTDPICRKGLLSRLRSYQPHITVVRFLEGRMGRQAHREWAKEWESIVSQFEPMDPKRIQFDRVRLFLSDFSQQPHRYVYEYTESIGQGPSGESGVARRGQLEFAFEG